MRMYYTLVGTVLPTHSSAKHNTRSYVISNMYTTTVNLFIVVDLIIYDMSVCVDTSLEIY